MGLLWRYLSTVLPTVEKELRMWRARAAAIPDAELRHQALASLDSKRFHCQGGAVFAARPGPHRRSVLRFIVALQTISDYLDNLCDRTGVTDATAFRLLHRALLDAVGRPPPAGERGYYSLFPYHDDGDYLNDLVDACRRATQPLPFYSVVQGEVVRLAELYRDLQVCKHMELAARVPRLTAWFGREWEGEEDLQWQEFAAASGSTLGIFALCDAAAGPSRPQPERLLDFYFPWTAGLHILLDYFIDLAEDERHGDLNFVTFYCDLNRAEARMRYLYEGAMERLAGQEDVPLHAAVLHGLPALYLSDPKVSSQCQKEHARRLLRRGGVQALALHQLCRLFRRCTAGS